MQLLQNECVFFCILQFVNFVMYENVVLKDKLIYCHYNLHHTIFFSDNICKIFISIVNAFLEIEFP